MEPVINKTGRAVTALAVLGFCISIIVWIIFFGTPSNSLHQSALSWSFTVLMVTVGALGLDTALARVIPIPKQ